jgi:Methyltransferase domain
MMNVLQHFLKWQVGLAKAETQTTAAERACLAKHASGKCCLVEIGVWHGVTTCELRKAMDPAGILYAVDPFAIGRLGFSAQRRIAQSEVGRLTNGKVEWIRTTGGEAAKAHADRLCGKVEFIFIDGDHSYEGIRMDWEGWSTLAASGCVIGLHDSRSTPTRSIDNAGSVRFTSEVVRRDPRYEVIDEVDSLTVVQRRPIASNNVA